LADQLGHLGADLFHLRRNEMNHALQTHRLFNERRRGAGGQQLEDFRRYPGHAHVSSTYSNYYLPPAPSRSSCWAKGKKKETNPNLIQGTGLTAWKR
jgi:hypothetical protein